MKPKKPEQKKPSELRTRAEEKLKSQITSPRVMSDKETQQLILELQVHQIELEVQNEELRKAQTELEESRTRYSDLYDFAPVGYFTFDKNGLIVEANLTAAKELGIERALIINKPFRTYIAAEYREIFDKHLQEVFRSDERQTCEIRLKIKNGSEIYAQLESIAGWESSRNTICRTSSIDITKLKSMEAKLKALSITDNLTGLYNRRGLFALVEQLFKLSKRQNTGMFMLYADIDNLKEINDTWGHKEGDLVIIDIANILKMNYRDSDIVARIGGDEFVVIPVGTDGDNMEENISRLQKNIQVHNTKANRSYKLSLSAGIAYYDPKTPCSVEELLAQGDKLMYEQKKYKQKS
ncbi:MAG: diguanylate cyclase [Thermodesulfovibrionales bacterium]|nr:diguanylate cyclase [Thermodesulfovibrionales bacterium]